MKVYEALANAFVKEGVTTVFGLMGNGNMYWWHSLDQRPDVEIYETRHEGTALSMAEGWARATGQPGICTVTQGPGLIGRPEDGLGPGIDDDLIIVLMRGGYSRLENTLFEDGKWLDVRSMRHTFQDTMEGRFTEAIERLTGKEVAAFMSASHQHPDIQIEAFVLDGGSAIPGVSATQD